MIDQDFKESNEIYVWGSDRFGQLGLGNKEGYKSFNIPKSLFLNFKIKMISCGEEHTAFISKDGAIYTVGSNSEGRLGIGDKTIKQSSFPCLVNSLSNLRALTISCGWGHNIAIMESGECYSWGVGEYGALGNPDSTSQYIPMKIPISNNKIFKTGSCGTRHSAIIDDQGQLFTFGSGDAGQLGNGIRRKENIPFHVASILEKIIQTSAGIFHTLALTDTGKVYGMGGNNFGQLGIGTKKSSTVPVKILDLENQNITKIAAGQFSAAINSNGDLFLWGTGVFGEFLHPIKQVNFSNKIKDLSLGGNFAVALDSEGLLYSWGVNSSGELGQGNYDSISSPKLIEHLKTKLVNYVSCGGSFSIALCNPRTNMQNPSLIFSTSNLNNSNKDSDKKYERRTIDQYSQINKNKIVTDASEKESLSKFKNTMKKLDSSEEKGDKKPIVSNEYEALSLQMKALLNKDENLTKIKPDLINPNDRIYSSLYREDEIKKLKEKLIQSEADNNLIRREWDNAKTKLIANNIEIDKLRKRLIDSNSKINDLEQNIHQKDREFNLIQEELANTRAKQELSFCERQQELSEKLLQISELELCLKKEKEEKEKILIEHQIETDKFKTLINTIEFQFEESKSELALKNESLSKEIVELKLLIEQLKKDYENEYFDKAKEIEINNSLQKEISEKVFTIDTLKNKLETNLNQMNQIQAKLIEETESNRRHLLEIENLKKSLSSNLFQIKELENKLVLEQKESSKIPFLFKELENLTEQNNRIKFENEELKMINSKKENECDFLNSDITSWKQIIEQMGLENNELKKMIEDLEEKNKKLVETLNLHLYNKASEFKERVLLQLKNSNSPQRIERIISSGHNLPYSVVSPLRLVDILEKEKKLTTRKVAEIMAMSNLTSTEKNE